MPHNYDYFKEHGLAEDGEIIMPIGDGQYTLRSGTESADFTAGSYVRLVGPSGDEILYWDHREWRDDPELVMGAIICAAANAAADPR